jgi:hypothetical protein
LRPRVGRRLEERGTENPVKSHLFFHYFQFSTDTDEYHLHFVETLLAYYHILLIFKPMVLARAIDLRQEWGTDLATVGQALSREHANVLAYFAKRSKASAAT